MVVAGPALLILYVYKIKLFIDLGVTPRFQSGVVIGLLRGISDFTPNDRPKLPEFFLWGERLVNL